MPDSAVSAVLVRHGESVWNAAGLLQGRTHAVGLTARGRAQARAADLGALGALRDLRGVRILTSPQLRALETAWILAERIGSPVEECAELREQGHGGWEGRPVAVYAPLLAAAGPDWAPPGGETFRELWTRVRGIDLTGAVVVTHGETIRALLAPSPEEPPRRIPPNGAVLALGGPGVMSFG
ncbi:histidine phosphatase family protein [Pseudonocardia sp. WMMC193]|uniref:histidine phosphatase family protein n=1 Tax=Pseudonocardia sp. WMMC193 TaxID=2911965 RepID=UPI001F16EB23|nr:histidine phosphatase family protein [Pseudonocardia sp. WMMC193]MCF7549841.1 histidine phosphatase family protein [Pseudonocardia sp. WMMC193]